MRYNRENLHPILLNANTNGYHKSKLIEQGNFETLMKKQGLFYELFLKQQY
ncbi:hypothetical protein HMPREF1391_00940 [Helicobacter pylori GAM100Ai]|uniref:Uncharacterized protein n=1 Tax=Helicobacter pylori GAM100Ai TaxID=1159019 RepID=A0AB72ZV11_HELPX|nr:hypothetical protein HMPREF1391_00940 [Helicobacter pylori GAM100Ai]EMG91019.1 hypothetical protein HMPREF1403_00519 [Helicobacter pylori GAM201Ai]